MAIGDPDFALEKLREFLALIAERDDDEIRKLLPVIEAIAKQMDPGKVSELKSVPVPLGGVELGIRSRGGHSARRDCGAANGHSADKRPDRPDVGCRSTAPMGLARGREPVGWRTLQAGRQRGSCDS